jgi:hypothetical protein
LAPSNVALLAAKSTFIPPVGNAAAGVGALVDEVIEVKV